MRLWFLNFDGAVSDKTKDRTMENLYPECDALFRRLSEQSTDQVIFISSRSIDDIAGRVSIPGVILGGCSGIEWQLPSGYRIGAFREHEENLIHIRTQIVSELYEIVSAQGLEIEDKLWSITVHTKNPDCNVWRNITKNISEWAIKHGLTYYSAPDKVDVLMIQGFNKSVGVSYITRQFNADPINDSIIYAGNDESDVAALRWTQLFGGTAIIVGDDLNLPGALYVRDRSHLLATINDLASSS